MIEGRPRESLVQYENPIEVELMRKLSILV